MASSPVRIRKHEAVPQFGSYEVCFADGRPSVISIGTMSRDGGSRRTC